MFIHLTAIDGLDFLQGLVHNMLVPLLIEAVNGNALCKVLFNLISDLLNV